VSPVLELTFAILLATGAVYFVLRPILQPATALWRSTAAEDEAGEDVSARAVALRALKEIEFDRATGKLSEADYDALRTKYTALALEALRDTGHGTRDTARTEPSSVSRVPFPGSRPACPFHGVAQLPKSKFCSECGRQLSPGHGFCGECGDPLAADARFCNACGARVAA
jgi:double zinc ribbon protein